MNAIFNAHRLSSNICLARENPTAPPESLTDPTGTFGKSAVFGFPYLDTLKLLEHGSISGGAIFYSKGDDEELQQLEERLRLGSTDESDLEPLQAVFCDQPIAQPAAAVGTGSVGTESRFALGGRRYCWLRPRSLLDDERLSPTDQPDIVVSSLSKVFSGVGNCMGGALTLNTNSPMYSELKTILDAQ